MCLVAFQKIFRKIFSGVWKRRRKTQIQKNLSHNPENTNPENTNPENTIAIRDRDLAGAISRRQDRDIREIAPSIAILIRRDLASRDRDRRLDLAKRRSRSSDWSSRDRRGLELRVRRRSLD